MIGLKKIKGLRKTTNEISFFKEIFNNLRTKATFRISLSDK